MKKIIFLSLFFLNLNFVHSYSNNKLYDKIDLFGEVLDKINKDYVEEVDQPKMIDSAINGVLQSLDPYSAYMSPDLFSEMQTDTRGEFGGLGIEIGMESGVDAGASAANRNKSPTGPNSCVAGTGVGADVVNIARCC